MSRRRLSRLNRQLLSNIRSLISYGKTIGLPTKMLEQIYLGNYKIAFHREQSGATYGARTLTFPKRIVKLLNSIEIDGAYEEALAVGVLFHEATHALIDENLKSGSLEFRMHHNRAKRYYTDSKFVDGSPLPDDLVDNAISEAAAWYVHENIYVWWMARETLEELTRRGYLHQGLLTAQAPPDVLRDLLFISQYARKANYGTSATGVGDEAKRLAKAIHPGLKTFCDDVVMEGKINLSLANYLNVLVAHHA